MKIPQIFDIQILESNLRPQDFSHCLQVIRGEISIDIRFASLFSQEIVAWAKKEGATLWRDWCHPFMSFGESRASLFSFEKEACLGIDQLDCSSLLHKKATFLNGFSVIDLSLMPFLVQTLDGALVLIIPSIFYSSGQTLSDVKTVLILSQEKITKSLRRLLKISGLSNNCPDSRGSIRQELYLVDLENRSTGLLALRVPPQSKRVDLFLKDLIVQGEIFGLSSVREIAPGQIELIFQEQDWAVLSSCKSIVDALISEIGFKHGLKAVFSEKPYKEAPISDLNLCWSLNVADGLSFFSCPQTPEKTLVFLIFMTALIHAMDEHQSLLSSFVVCFHLDSRLTGWNRNPFRVLLPKDSGLLSVFKKIIDGKAWDISEISLKEPKMDLGLICSLTSRGLELRGLGASCQPIFLMSVIQSAIADSLDLILDEVLDSSPDLSTISLSPQVLSVLGKHLKQSSSIFLDSKMDKNLGSSLFESLLYPKSERCFSGILSNQDLLFLQELYFSWYIENVNREFLSIRNWFQNEILLQEDSVLPIQKALQMIHELDVLREQTLSFGLEIKAKSLREIIVPKLVALTDLLNSTDI